MGKTGGTATFQMFQLFPELIEYADPLGRPGRHTAFERRPNLVRGKSRALNIRRLPDWILSFTMHKSRRGLAPRFEPQTMDSPFEMARSHEADKHLSRYLAGGEIEHWLRIEQLKEDFAEFISNYAEVTERHHRALDALVPENTAAYDRHLDHWFSPTHLELMYESNPLWARVEQQVYGRDSRGGAEQALG
jgi:hypothetical protein